MDGAKENSRAAMEDGGDGGVEVELPLGDAATSFDLEKAVCSHGFFMMAPNHWDPLSKTFSRPLLLGEEFDVSTSSSSSSSIAVVVCISHSSDTPQCLRIRVTGTDSLSHQHRESLLAQVRRMLRLTDKEERIVREFHKIHGEAEERGFGRLFRSPTLFEDMVKCILLCNCQWSRTLTMARALCELQLKLQPLSSNSSLAEGGNSTDLTGTITKLENFAPKTPAGKDSKRKIGIDKCCANLASRFGEKEADNTVRVECLETKDGFHDFEPLISTKLCKDESHICSKSQNAEEIKLSSNGIGNFPSPMELARLDVNFLAKHCNLGYRASRVVNLAKSVVEGRIQLRQIEEASEELSNYNALVEQLKEIDGFGPFTCANVLMCLGFYHVIPTDSETIRHLKKVHARHSDIRRVVQDVEAIYGKYAPFQFLAYWSEIWHFYGETFGKLSEMPHSDYARITASNMRPSAKGKKKRIKISSNEAS